MESTELFHYNASVILLIAAIQMRAFDTAIGRDREGPTPGQHPAFYYSPLALDEETAPAATRRIFDEMRRGLGIPFLTVAYRVCGRWPDFLADYWKLLREIIQSPVYIESQHGIRDTAWAVAAEIPRRVELTISQLLNAGIKGDDLGAIVRMHQLFVKSLSGRTQNVSVAKIGVEGGSASVGGTQCQASQPCRAA